MFAAKKMTKGLLAAAIATAQMALAADALLAQGRQRGNFQVAARTRLPQTRTGRATEQVEKVHIGRWQEFKPLLTRGDREFGGNGPRVRVFIEFFIEQNTVYRRISLEAHETNGGSSRAGGWSPRHLVYRPAVGRKIESFRGAPTGRHLLVDATMSGHGRLVRQTPLGRVTVFGDRSGTDIEVYTRVRIDFDFDLEVVLSDQPMLYDEVRLPATISFKPRHVAGDKDFKGHGPKVRVDAVVGYNEKGAYLTLYMEAQEVGGTTRAAGSRQFLLYHAPPGYRVKAVRGKRAFPGLINYTDGNHSVDRFNTLFGPAIVRGDRRGDDAGVYTRVEFTDIRRRVIIDLEQISP